MSKKNKVEFQEEEFVESKPKKLSVKFRIMNNCGPVPVAKPADFIQLTPIVQPIPIVPYNTQNQPLAQFEDDIED